MIKISSTQKEFHRIKKSIFGHRRLRLILKGTSAYTRPLTGGLSCTQKPFRITAASRIEGPKNLEIVWAEFSNLSQTVLLQSNVTAWPSHSHLQILKLGPGFILISEVCSCFFLAFVLQEQSSSLSCHIIKPIKVHLAYTFLIYREGEREREHGCDKIVA